MYISAAALHGIPGDTTLSVNVKIGNYTAVALLDSGRTDTFLDHDFVKKAKIAITPTKQHKVLVAGGGELTSEGHVPNCKFSIQNTLFQHDCKILPLKGYAMVLGANCLKKHSPNYTDWETRSLSITVDEKYGALLETEHFQQPTVSFQQRHVPNYSARDHKHISFI